MTKSTVRILVYCALIFFVFLPAAALFMVRGERYIPPDVILIPEGWYDYSGNIHFHTIYSDGGGTFEEALQAARNAGLSFLISADHNTVQPFLDNQEGWREGVLLLTAVELSTELGHLFFYDGSALFDGYDPEETIEMAKRKSAGIDTLLFIAHPFAAKNSFHHWHLPGFNGMEIFNGDIQWRDDSALELVFSLIAAFFLPDPQNHLIDYPGTNINKWDSLLTERAVTGIGSSDAHSNIRISKKINLRFPSYESSFKFVRTHLLIRTPLENDLKKDRTKVISALRRGAAYIELGNLCNPAGFLFSSVQDSRVVLPGDTIVLSDSVTLFAQSPDTTEIAIHLLKNGQVVYGAKNVKNIFYRTKEPGNYRVEIFQIRQRLPLLPAKQIPWIISNPIFVKKKETS